MSFHHLLIIGVEPMIIGIAFSKCHILDEKCPVVGRKATREQPFRYPALVCYASIARSSLPSNHAY